MLLFCPECGGSLQIEESLSCNQFACNNCPYVQTVTKLVRAYVHYHPTFYHFHVYFISVSYDAPGSHIGKAILLDDIIQNIQLRDDYYQIATLTCIVRERDPLLKFLKDRSDFL